MIPQVDLRVDFAELAGNAEAMLLEKSPKDLLQSFSEGIPGWYMIERDEFEVEKDEGHYEVTAIENMRYPNLSKGQEHLIWLYNIGIDSDNEKIANRLLKKALAFERSKPKPEDCTQTTRWHPRYPCHNICPPTFFDEVLKTLTTTDLLTSQAVICSLAAIFSNTVPPNESQTRNEAHICKISLNEAAKHIIRLATTCVAFFIESTSPVGMVAQIPRHTVEVKPKAPDVTGEQQTQNPMSAHRQKLRGGLAAHKRAHEQTHRSIATELRFVDAEIEKLAPLYEKQKRLKMELDAEAKEVKWAEEKDACLGNDAATEAELASAAFEIAVKLMDRPSAHQP